MGTPIELSPTGDREVASDLRVGGSLFVASRDVGALVDELLARVADLEARINGGSDAP
jgi:hypothetical protein